MMKSSTSPGKKLPKNLKNMDKLIAAVQARECLWDKNFRGHRNRFKLERLWNEVAAEVGATSVSCRKRWKNLKDQCRKMIKKDPSDCEWPHFQKLSFIHNQFTNEDDDNEDNETTEETFSGLDDSIKRPKLGYTIRKKFLVNKRRTIDVDLSKLIELVQGHEIIWNRQQKGHHNWYKLDQNWKEIAEQLGVTRDEARLKWKYVRDQARKESRKQDSDWDLLPKLQFLVNQFNETEYDNYFRGSLQNDEAYYKTEPEPVETAVESSEMQDEGVNHDDDDDDEVDEFDGKPELFETDFCDEDDEPLQRIADTASNAQDEDTAFFNSLLPHIKNLRADKKLMLRMKIQELVYKTVYNDG